MTTHDIERRLSFLGSPAAGMLERARIMLELAHDGMKVEDQEQAGRWKAFAEEVLVGAIAVRDKVLSDLRTSDSGIVLAAPPNGGVVRGRKH